MRDSAAVLHDNFPVLASALMVCRTCLALDADSLAHIVRLLDMYLNPFSRSWSVRRACELGLPRRAIEYLAARDPHWVDGYDIGALASKGGFVHVLQWALDCYPSRIAWDNGYTGYDRITLMDVAAQHGHLPVLQWFHENRSEGCSHRAMDYAAGNGRLDIVWWLEEHYTGSCSTRAMDDAATNGHLEVVKWLHLNHHEGCTKYAMNGAAQNGHLAVLEWLHANRSEGYAPSEGVMDSVAACGHLDVRKWFHDNTSKSCSPNAMLWAAARGHLDVVRFLHENRSHECPSISGAMRLAAMHGHLETVQWLYANCVGGRVGVALRHAAQYGHLDVVKWLCGVAHEQRRGDACFREVAEIARRSWRLEVAEYLERSIKRKRLQ
ncbi:uncharacterized protein IUM83_06483 [Phytophthora cinnamomi]|uniref:uncharacterized protein n=1 Tax=Phytophthora cinnamomi TaxID=4785 RepID=UPI00355A937D|nr:hypothetical protein IUM83_06483 [Phytophthora cinnamomi]